MTPPLQASVHTLGALACLTLAAAAHAQSDPIELDASDDTFLSSEHTGKPAGRGKKDELQIYGKSGNNGYRALLKFDLSTVPGGFRGAVLQLTGWNAHWKNSGRSLLRVHAMTASWDEDNASWDQSTGAGRWKCPGGDWNPQAVCAYPIDGPIGGAKQRTYKFDVSAAARIWKAQPNRNHGIVVMLDQDCTAELRFRSKDFNTASQRPKLLLYYRRNPPASALSIPAQDVPPLEPPDPTAPVISARGWTGTAKIGEELNATFSASGGKAPYMFGPTGRAPSGVRVNRDGKVTGKATRAGSYIFGVMCVAGDGKRATYWVRLNVVDPNAPPPKPARTPEAAEEEGEAPPPKPTNPLDLEAAKKKAEKKGDKAPEFEEEEE